MSSTAAAAVAAPADEYTFSITGKGLKFDSVSDCEPYLSQLREMKDVRTVILSGNTFSTEAASAFAEVLKDKVNIERALFSDIFTGRLKESVRDSVSILSSSLVDKECLMELDLSDNAFGPIGSQGLPAFLKEHRWIQSLKLNNNGLGIQGATLIAEALIERQRKNVTEGHLPQLKVFIAGRNRLENGSSERVAEMFAAYKDSLTEVRIPQNGIRPEGIKNLASALAQCTKLEILDLQDNTLALDGARAIGRALPNWTELRHLNLGDMLAGTRGGMHLGRALNKRCNTELRELYLGFNEIDISGAELIAQALAAMPLLTLLDLNGNAFPEDSPVVDQIVAALEAHGHADALGSLSEMEELTDAEDAGESEDEEEEEEEEEEEVQVAAKPSTVDADVDELADILGKQKLDE
ncbi:RNI-like protein [Ramicandelaber brevisporus]|nr:RNI-like protein [Ramicandelaber brevisporus]